MDHLHVLFAVVLFSLFVKCGWDFKVGGFLPLLIIAVFVVWECLILNKKNYNKIIGVQG